MTAISYVSDLTDIFMFESTTNVSSIGGGAGAAAGIDFTMEGTNAVDRKVSNVIGNGFIYDSGTPFGQGANDSYYIWVTTSTPGAASRVMMAVGDDAANFGNVELHMGGGGNPAPPPNTLNGQPYATNQARVNLATGQFLHGTPSSTPDAIGVTMSTFVAVQGNNLACDGARWGSGYDITLGTGADDPGDFAGLAADDVSTSQGIFQPIPGGYQLLGQLRLGDSSNPCEFSDSNTLIALKSYYGVGLSTFHDIIIEHADSVLDLTFVSFLGPQDTQAQIRSVGGFRMTTVTATVNLTSCTFQDFGNTVLGSGATFLNCTWTNTEGVEAKGADLRGCTIRGRNGTGESGVIWDGAVDPDGLLDGMEFNRGTFSTHAIEFGLTSPTTMTLNNIDFNDFNASNGQTDSTFDFLRTTGTVTLTLLNCTGNFSYNTAGAIIVIVANPATLTLTATDVDTGSPISGARAYITPSDNTGPFPWEESVTSITRVTTTATVAHTAHGMLDGQQVLIEGAEQDEYNGIQTITNVLTDAYDYTVSGSPTTPATGTIIATAVIINETTTAGGVADDTRVYTADQPITGRIRSSSASTYYRTAPVTGIIDKDSGLNVAVLMLPDE